MKKFYITIFAILGLSILIFMLSFVYLDKNKHKVYYFAVSLNGHNIGNIKVDKFITEDKLIYKSASSMPLSELFTESKSKMVFDRKYELESYVNERTANGASDIICIENKSGNASYVARLNSRFAFLDEIPLRKETFVFEENSPVTYLPIIENYNFSRGKSQGFSAISCFTNWELPPMKRLVTLTSIKDEYVKIGRRKIKTENLLLKIRNFPQGAIWVAKTDRSLIAVDFPSAGLKLTRVFNPGNIAPEAAAEDKEGYISKAVFFNNNKTRLAGTLTVPLGKEKYPAIILVWGDAPDNRDYRGLFKSLAGYLAENGFCAFRFDKRGVGSSDGNYNSYSGAEELEDLKKAIGYLAARDEVDPGKIFVIAHSRGARFGMRLAAESPGVKGLVLMSPAVYSRYAGSTKLPWYPKSPGYKKWSKEYLKSVSRSTEETRQRALAVKGNWVYIMFRRCFAARIKEDASQNYDEIAAKVKAPVLILQGNKDEDVPAEAASDLDDLFRDCGNLNHTLIFYGYLGHFFGKNVIDGIHRNHYDIDKEVSANLVGWLNGLVAELKKPEEEPKNAPAAI